MENLDYLGERVRILRKMRGWTLRELAEKASLSVGYVSDLERGDKRWNIEILDRVAKAFVVPSGLLQDPSVEIDQLPEIAGILSQVTKLTKEQLHTIQRMLDGFGAKESEGEKESSEALRERPTQKEALLFGKNTSDTHVFLEQFQSLSENKKHRILQNLGDLVRLEAFEREKAS